MIDILSLMNSGGQVKLEVTAGDLQHFAAMLIEQTGKEVEERLALARAEEPEEIFLNTKEVCKIFGVTPATLCTWHKRGYLCHVKFGNKNMYPASAVRAITHARSMNVTVDGYCRGIKKKGGVEV